jgi:long-chain fatty acid transport protein
MRRSLKALSFSSILFAPIALGAGFQLNEFSVAAMGRAQAGEPAMTDTAAVVARNPAAMGGFDKANISIVYHYIDPDIDVEGNITTPNPLVGANADADDVAPSASIPGLYYVNPINGQWAIGLSINSHFGLSTDYGHAYAGSEFAQETSIKTYYLTPSISFKPIESLSLGLGINYIYGEGIIENSTSPTIATITGNAIPNNTTLLKLDGDGDAWGYQLGLTWDINSNNRIGFRYQSAVNLDFEGDMQLFVSVPPPGATLPFTGTLTVKLPDIYELGYVSTINEKVKIMAGIQQTSWSRFENLTAELDQTGSNVLLKDEDWKDAWRYSVGSEFTVAKSIILRAGIGYDESPVRSAKRTLTIPDGDRQWYSLGATFNLESAGSIDAAFMYLTGDSVEVNEPHDKLPTQFNGKLTSVGAYIYSVGYNYSF